MQIDDRSSHKGTTRVLFASTYIRSSVCGGVGVCVWVGHFRVGCGVGVRGMSVWCMM